MTQLSIFGGLSAVILFGCSTTQTNTRSTLRSLRSACSYIENNTLQSNQANGDASDTVSRCHTYLAFRAYDIETTKLLIRLSLGYSAMNAVNNGVTDINQFGVETNWPIAPNCSRL